MRATTLLLTAAFAAALAQTAASQGVRDAATGYPAGCTYQTCALRLEPSFLTGERVVRGASGEAVGGRAGMFGRGVHPLLTGPDSAARYARDYVRATDWANILGIPGAVALTYGLIQSRNGGEGARDAAAVTAVVGAAFVVASIPFAFNARRSLSRSIWWYNAGLPR
jgi:hypothetical protein